MSYKSSFYCSSCQHRRNDFYSSDRFSPFLVALYCHVFIAKTSQKQIKRRSQRKALSLDSFLLSLRKSLFEIFEFEYSNTRRFKRKHSNIQNSRTRTYTISNDIKISKVRVYRVPNDLNVVKSITFRVTAKNNLKAISQWEQSRTKKEGE